MVATAKILAVFGHVNNKRLILALRDAVTAGRGDMATKVIH